MSGASAAFGYDQENRLTSYTRGTTTASYVCSGDGLRMSKTVNGTSTGGVWDLAESLPLMIQDGQTKYIAGPDGLPIEQIDGSGKVAYSLQDQLGSTRGLIDSTGTIIAGEETFDAWGKLAGEWGQGTPFGYAGQYTDAESGLQYLQSRCYDPSTAQFLTVDPLASLTGEPYAHSDDDPLDGTDPDGLCAAGAEREPVVWGPVGIGKCQAVITGVGYDPDNQPHFSLRIYKGTRQIFNYHIYYAQGTPPGVMRWRVEANIKGEPRRRSYRGAPGSDATRQAVVAAQQMAKDVQRQITGKCGKTNIRDLLTQRTRRFSMGVLPYVFLAVWSAKEANDVATPVWCPLPPPFSCN